jgi:hypothetical protein
LVWLVESGLTRLRAHLTQRYHPYAAKLLLAAARFITLLFSFVVLAGTAILTTKTALAWPRPVMGVLLGIVLLIGGSWERGAGIG